MRTALKIVLILFLTGVMIALVISYRLLQSTSNNTNLEYIPEESVFAARLNSGEILRQTLTAILETKDEELIRELKKIIPDKDLENQTGIDYASNVYYFVLNVEGENVEGTLYNLLDSDKFEAYYTKQSNAFAFSSNDDVGVLLQYPKDFTAKNKLIILSADIIGERANSNKTIQFNNAPNTIISTWSRKTKGSAPHLSNNIDLFLDHHEIRMNGEVNIGENQYRVPYTSLKPNGFHFSSSFIPEEVNDSIRRFLRQHGLSETPDLISASINYSGVSVLQSNQLQIIPDFELLLMYADTVNVDQMIQEFVEKGIIQKKAEGGYHIRDIGFQIQPYNKSGILLNNGVSPTATENKKSILTVSGSPHYLFEIGGNSLYGKFIQVLPLYSSSKSFAQGIDGIEITIVPVDATRCKLTGVMKFEDKAEPLLEIIKFLNRSGLIK